MDKDFGVKTWMYPLPVLIVAAYDEEGRPNAMNAAWGCIYNDDLVHICLSRGHKTTANILASKAFTLSFGTRDQLAACDYVGITSGNKEADKIARAGWTTRPSSHVNAPVINELRMRMECELVSADGEQIVGRIVNVSADESVLGPDGLVDYRKLDPVTYDPVHMRYIALGEEAGKAFSAGKEVR